METIISNIAGKIRRESLQGRLYLVAPLTMIVPGVLSGSRGSLYYPLEEIRKNPTAWNGMPITLGHPSIDGKPVSARTPEVLNTKALGMILRTQADQELISEGWFDIELTNRSAPGLIDRIEAGKKVEVSTFLHFIRFFLLIQIRDHKLSSDIQLSPGCLLKRTHPEGIGKTHVA